MSDTLAYHYRSAVKVGELERYVIEYTLFEDDEIPEDIVLDSLWVRVKNCSPLSFRAGYLAGPFILYTDLRSQNYHHSQKIVSSSDYPQYESNMQAQQSRVMELSLHKIQSRYVWVLDVVSQILFTTNTNIPFEVTIGRNKEYLSDAKDIDCLPDVGSVCNQLVVSRLTTDDIWKLPRAIAPKNKKKHLVILTHGLHSNVSVDMSYLMEQIYNAQVNYPDEVLVVDGYFKNVCETEKGIRYLGTRITNYIINELYDENVKKISFIGHSLGGLVQTFVIAQLAAKYPWFFEKVVPVNFITIASPMLGIVTDNPAYINLLLSFGVVGKTGKDLNLDIDLPDQKPLIYSLSGELVRSILRRFKNRTLYANAVNDGIVPLYTAGLLFLDYDSILKKLKEMESNDTLSGPNNITVSDNTAFFNKNFISPLTKMLSLWAPQKFPNDNSQIPKVSFFQSAASILIPPIPDTNYIVDPQKRNNIIIHDKIYGTDDSAEVEVELDEDLFTSKNIFLQVLSAMTTEKQKYQQLEKSIAIRWHKDLTWRKVIVALKPDSHNNIIVRRRFANAYGWPIIDHIIENHFGGDVDKTDLAAEGITTSSESFLESPLKNTQESNDWVLREDQNSLFKEGPTGLISTVGEMVETLAKRSFPNFTADGEVINQISEDDSYNAVNYNMIADNEV
ncbi:putative lipase ROG1 [Nakaseomyces bracarensis]|uniref:putative lipase ROG1 n=1 Tax=Nakaseomyces bracarensis TaxID=273131 RepID=UPI00387123DE